MSWGEGGKSPAAMHEEAVMPKQKQAEHGDSMFMHTSWQNDSPVNKQCMCGPIKALHLDMGAGLHASGHSG